MKRYCGDLVRVNKTVARRLYNNGCDVLLLPCNIRPDSIHIFLGVWENVNLLGQYESFDKLCDWYQIYNCCNQYGKYISFYIRNEATS